MNAYVAFTSSVIFESEEETNGDSTGGSEEHFLNTHKTMLGKWEQVCDFNIKLAQENFQLKGENMKLTKQIEAKESF